MRHKRFVRAVSKKLRACVRARRALGFALGLLALSTAGAGAALGCGWNFYDSVRFNFDADDGERQRMPPLPFTLREDKQAAGKKLDEEEDGGYAEEQEAAETEAELVALRAGADEALRRGDFDRAREMLREFVARAGDDAYVNTAVDQLDALSALDEGSPAAHVRAYLLARTAYDSRVPTNRVLDEVPKDRNLDDNVAYLQAATLYQDGPRESEPSATFLAAADAFRALAAKYPRSEKREAALYMAARAELSRSGAYAGDGATATSEDACPDCRDDAWRAAVEGFRRVLKNYPRGRLAGEARGWLAYLALRVGDTGAALAEYYRMLGEESDEGARREALLSLKLARGRAGETDMERVERELEDEPRAALAYAYHDIYNYTQGYYFNTPGLVVENPYGKDSTEAWEWESEQEAQTRGRAERRNLARVARFAARMVARHPSGGAFAVRVAQANLELGETETALEVARRALGRRVEGAERAGALWVEAVALYRLRDFDASRRTLALVVKEFPGGDLSHNARRLLATVAEEAGDLGAALEQYLALGYETDAAYFVDVLMKPEQLAVFVESHDEPAWRDRLLYALGVRYLRAGRYAEARAALMRVRTTSGRSTYDDYYDRYDEGGGDKDPKYHLRGAFWDEAERGGAAAEPGVYADWVLRDLKTADDLERLERDVARANGDEAKAEAMYQLASYLYEGSNLKFYNPREWHGMRAELLASLDEGRYRSAGEAEIIWGHAREHETLARALNVYLEVARLYPETRAARDALYTAVLCQQRLSDFNTYWRTAYDMGLHAGARLVTLADLRRAYPRYKLPVEGEWRPSTRTVDGGPAWPAPPKPQKPTGTERLRRKLRRAESLALKGWELYGEVAGGRARRWSLAFACGLAALLVLRATRRSRTLLYELLRRAAARRKRPPELLQRPASSYAAHEPYTPRARLHAAAGGLGHALLEVVLDARGRAALALNLLTHGLLTALLYALAWSLRAG